MRTLICFTLFAVGASACRTDSNLPLLTSRDRINGTYEVTRLAQYQDGRKILEGYLPYLLNDSITITHRLGVSLSKSSEDGTDAYILRNLTQSVGNRIRSKVANIGGLNIIIRQNANPLRFDFYQGGTVKIGQYESERDVLSFDLVERDSLNQETRYVFEAKKISSVPNQF